MKPLKLVFFFFLGGRLKSMTSERKPDESLGLLLIPRGHLDDEGLVLEAGRQAQHAHVGRLVDEVLDAVEDSATGGRDAAVDAALADGLARHAGVGVYVLSRQNLKTILTVNIRRLLPIGR